MKIRFLAGAVGMLVAASMTFAQDATVINAGAKAVLFTLSGLSDLGAKEFDGGVGAKYFISPAMAVRAGLRFTSASEKIAANPAAGATGADGSKSAFGFGISGGVEYHLTNARISPYFGGGLKFYTLSTEYKTASNNTTAAPQDDYKNVHAGSDTTGFVSIGDKRYIPQTTFGIGGLGGVEFFLTKELSLSAEYQLGLTLSSYPDQTKTTGPTTTTTKNGSATMFGISALGALTLAFYF